MCSLTGSSNAMAWLARVHGCEAELRQTLVCNSQRYLCAKTCTHTHKHTHICIYSAPTHHMCCVVASLSLGTTSSPSKPRKRRAAITVSSRWRSKTTVSLARCQLMTGPQSGPPPGVPGPPMPPSPKSGISSSWPYPGLQRIGMPASIISGIRTRSHMPLLLEWPTPAPLPWYPAIIFLPERYCSVLCGCEVAS